MQRVAAIKRAGEWDARAASDVVVLDAQDRQKRRIVFVGEQGACYLLDLPRPAQLRDGDALELENGARVRVVGRPEPLVEVSAASARELSRLAWHLGNRHAEVQFVGERLRIRRDHVLEEMLRGLGAQLAVIEAPFDPEGGAHRHGNGHDA
jgi:urease accessory protein